MNILVINCGSSSIKVAVVDHRTGQKAARMHIERIGEKNPTVRFDGEKSTHACAGATPEQALDETLPQLMERLPEGLVVEAVGHRVVHGGERFREPTRIDDDVQAAIADLIELAPLHNPANLMGIVAARKRLPDLNHVAVFDTAFHATLPKRAQRYAIDHALAKKHGIRRYGFHGTSHAYVAARAAEFLGTDLQQLRLITCHLGNGASVCAIEYGRSIDTSMGMTPVEGLVMGTRAGDIDAGVLLYLMRHEDLSIDEADDLINRRSGLRGLSGRSNDMRDIEEAAAQGDEQCRMALRVFSHRLRKYIGAYAALLGGVDAVIFTAGVGENSALIRHRAGRALEFLGARLDEDLNRNAKLRPDTPVIRISTPTSRTHILVVATDEQHAIAQETAALAEGRDRVKQSIRPIPVAVSARHIHVTDAMVERLFGAGYTLTSRKPLSQPGQFSCEETLDVVGPKRTLKGVRIIGPSRKVTQVEISRTDEFYLGIDAPVRNSGDVKGSAGVTLVGPYGRAQIDEGVICARRHIHMKPEDADRYGVNDRDVIDVAIDSDGRDLVFGDVLVRVSPSYHLEMHIDTDEANAAELSSGDDGMLVVTRGSASLVRRTLRHERGGKA